MLKTRVLTAVLLGIGIISAVFFLPVPAWALLVAALVWVVCGEWSRLTSASKNTAPVFGVLVVAAVLAFAWLPDSALRQQIAAAVYVLSLCFWFLVCPVLLYRFTAPKAGLWAWLAGLAIIPAAGFAMIELRAGQFGAWLLLAAIFAVNLADIGAFFVGRAWGRRKLARVISPGKSWEGFVGGVAAVLIFAAIVWYFTPAVSAAIPLWAALGFALVYALMSAVGDLFESVLKRRAGVKDSGTLLPGHGGALDRIDSLLPTLPMVAALLAGLRLFS